MKIRYQVALPTSLLVLTILCGLFLSSTIVKADNNTTSDSVSIQINTACTITTGGGTYSDNINPGSYKEITGNNINVSCNDAGGYALYAIGFSGNSYDAPDNNKMLGSGSNYIPTAAPTNDNTSSYWAMKVSTSSSASATPSIDNSYGSYQIIPATYTKISHYSGATVGTTNNSVTAPTYKVNISSGQAADTYTGKVKYTMVYPNGAVGPAVPKTYLQDATIAKCGKTMYDSRDLGEGTAYTTALIGGQCWMTTNLNLAGGTALSADDTDVTSAYISSFSTSNNLTKSGNTIVLPASSTSGFSTNNYSYVFNSGKTGTDCSDPGCYSYYSWDATTLGSGRKISFQDAPYSICPKGWHLPRTSGIEPVEFMDLIVALGGSESIRTYDSSTTPTGATMSSALRASPYNFLFAGYYFYGSLTNAGYMGGYWTPTVNLSSSTNVDRFDFDYTIVRLNTGDSSSKGYPVRCVLNS